jgi:RNA polymerase sigma-70 factor (ECF subfamily)
MLQKSGEASMHIERARAEVGDGQAARSAADRAMESYADGDDQAFAVVYDAVAPRLAAYVRRCILDRQLVDDVVQQTFLNMHRARSTFVRGAPALPWAFAIARRLMAESRRTGRRKPAPGPLDHDVPVPARADELVFAHEAAARIDREVALLPPAQRQAFELLKEDELSLAQAATVTGTTVTAVKLRAHRAIATLRALLKGDFGSKGGNDGSE